jgi:hypothetical protein
LGDRVKKGDAEGTSAFEYAGAFYHRAMDVALGNEDSSTIRLS